MKKSLLVLSLVGVIGFSAVSCTNNEGGNVTQNITDIKVNVPSYIVVGETKSISYEVVGDSQNEALFKSSDEEILSVSSDGKITGKKAGTVTITVSSKKNPEIKKDVTITVKGVDATKIKLVVPTSDAISFDDKNSLYLIKLGAKVKFSYEFLEENVNPNDYDLRYCFVETGTEDSSISSLEIDETTGEFIASIPSSATGVATLRVLATKKNGSNDKSVFDDIKFKVVDTNAEMKTEILNKLSGSLTYEKDHLDSLEILTTIDKTKTTKNYYSYKNQNIVEESVNDGTTITSNKFYSGIKETGGNISHYVFDYKISNKKPVVSNIYKNEVVEKTDDANYVFDVTDNIITYGLGNIVKDKFFNRVNLNGKYLNFANTYVYANSSMTKTGDNYKLTSSYVNEDTTYKVDLELSFENNAVKKYTFKSSISSGSETTSYTETINSINYVTEKKELSATDKKYFDFDSLLFTNLNPVFLHGSDEPEAPLYSDENKYGLEAGYPKTETVEGYGVILHYKLRFDKTLVIKIKDNYNASANANIDVITGTSTNTKVVSEVKTVKDGVFAINPATKTTQYGLEVATGTTIITFSPRSNKYMRVSIIVEFYKPEISEVYLSNNENFTNGVKESIFVDGLSKPFYVNTKPADISETDLKTSKPYKVVVTNDAPKDGIEIYKNLDGNIDGLYGYSIKGIKAGDYKFKVLINTGTDDKPEWSDESKSVEYSILVKEKISAENIKKEITNKKFIFGSITNANYVIATFDDTNLNLSWYSTKSTKDEASTSQNEDLNVVVQKIPYSLEAGVIKTAGKEFKDSSFRFTSLMNGQIKFNEDFTTLTFYFSYSDGTDAETQAAQTSYTYVPTKFNLYIDENNLDSYLKGKTFTYGAPKFDFDVTKGTDSYLKFCLSFGDDGKNGKISIFKTNSDTLEETKFENDINFTYSVDKLGINFKVNEADLKASSVIKTFDSVEYKSEVNGDTSAIIIKINSVTSDETSSATYLVFNLF